MLAKAPSQLFLHSSLQIKFTFLKFIKSFHQNYMFNKALNTTWLYSQKESKESSIILSYSVIQIKIKTIRKQKILASSCFPSSQKSKILEIKDFANNNNVKQNFDRSSSDKFLTGNWQRYYIGFLLKYLWDWLHDYVYTNFKIFLILFKFINPKS